VRLPKLVYPATPALAYSQSLYSVFLYTRVPFSYLMGARTEGTRHSLNVYSCNFTVRGIAKCLGDPLALLVIAVLLGRDDVKAHFKPLNLAAFCLRLWSGVRPLPPRCFLTVLHPVAVDTWQKIVIVLYRYLKTTFVWMFTAVRRPRAGTFFDVG
jgi:hypothetical protein